MATISASVGRDGKNIPADVGTVQTLLNGHTLTLGIVPLKVNNAAGPETIAAIEAFQLRVVKLARPDGRVDVDGRTLAALAAPTDSETSASNLSGAGWWHANQAKFPNSRAIDDLESPFREDVKSFVDALIAAGATVKVGSTRRNKKRAYLMHYSWDIAKGMADPAQVPVESGVDISWNHGELTASKAAAGAMMDLFALAHRPSLTSLHISGLAIDMDITWPGTLNVKKKNGDTVEIGAPRNGADNKTLHSVGATYGVKKLASDPPHWSWNGH